MAGTFQVVTRDFVNVLVTNSQQENACVERRFQKGITIGCLKGKLELVTGGLAATMKLQLYNKDDTLLCFLDDDTALLGSLPVDDGMRIHVIDNFTLRDEMENASNVEAFKLSEEDYAKRTDTVKAFLERNHLGKYNEQEMKRREEERLREEKAEEAAAKAIKIGDRCEVSVPGQPVRRATVMFVGEVHFKKGWWIGVKYDEPLGKNDGSTDGKRYFECQQKYGGFVKPIHVTVGDFPEDLYDLDEEM